MKKSKSRSKTKLFSASSEVRKGFTMPTMKKIKSVLMSRSKTFLVNLVLGMMVGMSKSAKIKVLVKIEKGTIARKVKRKSKAVKRKSSTKRKGSTFKKPKSSNGRKGKKGKGFQGKVRGSKAEKTALAKAKRARKK